MTFAQPFAEYEILDRVGAGAMGTVFKARHKKLNRIVALKVLKPSLARDSRYVDRLKREARIVASLNHPNIVTGFDLGEEGGYHFFVMEFVEGKSLRAMLTEWGMFAEEYVRKVARQVAQALDHAFQRGVIHRDIKPGNILIDEAGNVKLTDMGLAKGPADLTITRDGATVGTPQYISPEQARNPHDVDVRTDLYSLGATLYHMATGVPPFRGDTMAELITNVLNELPISPRAINSALTEGMSLVIRKLLAKDLAVRYQTPRELLDDLDRLDRSLPPEIDPQRLQREEGQRRRVWPRVVFAVVVPVLLAVAWWIGLQMREPGPPQPDAADFIAALDQKLAGLASVGERLVHLRSVASTTLPLGSASEIELRHRTLEAELQRQVDAVATELLGEGFAALRAWVLDPAVWPDRASVLRERLQPRLFAAAGLVREQLPSSIRQSGLDEAERAITKLVSDRDDELVRRFEHHLQTKVAAAAEAAVRADDFAAAESAWSQALTRFCNGVDQPLPARLPEATLRLLQERLRAAAVDAQNHGIDPAETRVATALRAEVAAACGVLTQGMRDGLEPETALDQLQRFRANLLQSWPPTKSFRPGRSPWLDVDGQLEVLRVEIEAASARRRDERFAGRCDRAWRAFCMGRAADATAVLADDAASASASASRVAIAAQHRAALTAAAAVEDALLQAVAHSARPVLALLRRGSAEGIELHAEQQDGRWRFVGNAINAAGQQGRGVALGELRFSELLATLRRDADPLASLPAAERALGLAVWRLAADDLGGIDAVLDALPDGERAFVADEVWPRLLRVRGERDETPLDRQQLWRQFATALEAARQQPDSAGELAKLQAQFTQYTSVVPEQERTEAEVRELRAAKAFLQTARRRAEVAAELAHATPPGASVVVQMQRGQLADELVAELVIPAAALREAAADGWQLRGDRLEFTNGGLPWRDIDKQSLRCNPGLPRLGRRTAVTVDFVLPPTSIGRRFWVFEVAGVAFVLVLGANDTPHAAWVDGDVRREDAVARAFQIAVHELMEPVREKERRDVVVPGGVHRLLIELQPAAQGAAARARVLFERTELLPWKQRALDVERPPSFTLHPQQDLALQRVAVRAEGL